MRGFAWIHKDSSALVGIFGNEDFQGLARIHVDLWGHMSKSAKFCMDSQGFTNKCIDLWGFVRIHLDL